MTAAGGGGKVQSGAQIKGGSRPNNWLVRGIEIGEARDGGLELQFHRAGRAMALFADDQFRLARHAFAFGEPFVNFSRFDSIGLRIW